MGWTQVYAPLANLAVSALTAAVPLAVVFVLLASGKVPGWAAALASLVCAFSLAVGVWRMPAVSAVFSALYGVAFAILPILWIVVSALWVHELCVESGQFEVIRTTLASITSDRRLQALFIAFAFGAFLEGAAGFGTPVAITVAMLVGLGFEARPAATICLLANSSPVAFAAAGVPVAAAAAVSGLDVVSLGRIIGLQVTPLTLIVPLWLCVVLCGWRKSMEVLPAILTAGILFAGTQLLISTFSGPWTAGLLSAIVTLAGLWLLFRIWKPRSIWDFPGASGTQRASGAQRAARGKKSAPSPSGLTILRAWAPYLLMSLLVLLWAVGPVRHALQHLDLSFPWPLLDGRILRGPPVVAFPAPYRAVYSFAIFSAPGTAIFIAGLLSILILPGLGARRAFACLGRTVKALGGTIATVCLVLATASVMNYSGMNSSLGLALAATGVVFPAFSPLLGWLGVLLSGSDTSSNALFGSLQRTTAERLGLNPGLTVAANATGGVAGKMISPQSILVATVSARLPRQEGRILRSTIGHSIAMALIVSAIAMAMAYLVPSLIR
ncbi:MAG TPA: lactate permease LctP family transporter [Spirochaetia bacterium]|nr:lactate permease LctP family transporter [Spirochaetia bacterium]